MLPLEISPEVSTIGTLLGSIDGPVCSGERPLHAFDSHSDPTLFDSNSKNPTRQLVFCHRLISCRLFAFCLFPNTYDAVIVFIRALSYPFIQFSWTKSYNENRITRIPMTPRHVILLPIFVVRRGRNPTKMHCRRRPPRDQRWSACCRRHRCRHNCCLRRRSLRH
jgi:hypothetical protein